MCPDQNLALREEEAQAFYQKRQGNSQGYGGNNYNPNWRSNQWGGNYNRGNFQGGNQQGWNNNNNQGQPSGSQWANNNNNNQQNNQSMQPYNPEVDQKMVAMEAAIKKLVTQLGQLSES